MSGADDFSEGSVAEVAGLNGAFSFPERLLQQIWLRGDFDARALRLRDGRPLRLRRRGRWNRLAGPDFADAELEIDDGDGWVGLRGAVEVHLRAADWDQHGHATDPAYDAVVLHVVLFPSMREWTPGAGGRRIPILELLPLLDRDLEAYAEEAAVEGIAGRPYSQLREAMSAVSAADLRQEVGRYAACRWSAKVRFAGLRIERLGWESACHQAGLEVLGYRPNRVPMLVVAEVWPLLAWREAGAGDAISRGAWISAVMETVTEDEWARGGVRPANQPRRRLAQYLAWVTARPFWPETLADLAKELAVVDAADGAMKRPRGQADRRERLAEAVCGGALGGTRFDTMVCDAWLPLLAARAEAEGNAARVLGLGRRWREWPVGDLPAELTRLAREFQVAGVPARALKQGDLQGLLGWLASLTPRDGRGA